MTIDPAGDLEAVTAALTGTPQTLDELAATTGVTLARIVPTLGILLITDAAESLTTTAGTVGYRKQTP